MKYALLTIITCGWLGAVSAFNPGGPFEAAIQLSLTPTSPTCAGFTDGTILATPSGGTEPYAFTWSNGQSGATNLGVAAGTYSVTVKDAAGLTATGSATVVDKPVFAAKVAPQSPSCGGVFSPLAVNTGSATGPFKYQWSNGQTTATVTPTKSDNFFVTVTDGQGCVDIADYYQGPSNPILVATDSKAPTCFGASNGTATTSIFGTYPPFTYSWSNGQTTANLTNLTPGFYNVTFTDAIGCTEVRSVTVPEQIKIVVDVQGRDALCYNQNDGVAKVDVKGGAGGYTFKWSNGATAPVLEGLKPDTYTVTVTDAAGCTVTGSRTIRNPDSLKYSLKITPALCGANGSVEATVSGGTPPYMFVWNGTVFAQNLTNAAPGQYYLCVFDANKCQKDIIVTVPGGGKVDISLSMTPPDCAGKDNGSATVSVNPASGNYTYKWTVAGATGSQVTNLASGTIVGVTVTDNVTGCQGTASGLVVARSNVAVQASQTNATCAAPLSGTAGATATGGTTPYAFEWTLPNGTKAVGANLSGLGTGAYTVTATDAKGCTNTATTNVTVGNNVQARFGFRVLECAGDSLRVQLVDSSASATAWQWKVTAGSFVRQFTQQNPPTFNLPAGVGATIELTASAGPGCTNAATRSVTLPGRFSLIVEAPNVDEMCGKGNVPLRARPSNLTDVITYQWSTTNPALVLTGATTANPTATANNSGTYTVTVVARNQNGCTATSATTFTIREKLDLNPLGNSNILTCDSLISLLVQVNRPAVINWFDATGKNVGSGLSIRVKPTATPTAYRAIATSSGMCSDTATFIVRGSSLVLKVETTSDNQVCAKVPTQFKATPNNPTDVVNYQWLSPDPAVAITGGNTANPTITASTPGSYTINLTARNQAGCTYSQRLTFNVRPSTTINPFIKADACTGLNVTFSNTSDVTGTWFFGDNTTSNEKNPVHTYARAGRYNVRFVASNAQQQCIEPFTTPINVTEKAAVAPDIAANLKSCTDWAVYNFKDNGVYNAAINSRTWTFLPSGQTLTQPNPEVTFTQEGKVTAVLIVTDANGCVGRDTMPVSVDVVKEDIMGNTEFCPSNPVALNAEFNNTYTYNWVAEPADPKLVSTSPNPVVAPTVPTRYRVTITKGACAQSRTVEVTPKPEPTVQASDDRTVCELTPVTLTATVNGNTSPVQWSDNANFSNIIATGNSATVTPRRNGVYFVRAQHSSGCSVTDSVKINNGAARIEGVPAQRNICNGNKTELTVTNLISGDILAYQWNNSLPGLANQTITPTATNTYNVTVTNQLGCTATTAFNVAVIKIVATADVMGKDTICPGEAAQLEVKPTGSSNYTYTWSPAATLSNASIANPMARPDQTTVYSVTVSDANQCSTTVGNITVFFRSLECQEPFIFIPKAFTPNNDQNNDMFRVRGVDIKKIYFVVYNRWGEKVYETEDPQHIGWNGMYNNKESTPDAYSWYLEATCGNGEVFKKRGDVTLLK